MNFDPFFCLLVLTFPQIVTPICRYNFQFGDSPFQPMQVASYVRLPCRYKHYKDRSFWQVF